MSALKGRRAAMLAFAAPLLVGKTLAEALLPEHLLVDQIPPLRLNADVPEVFGDWQALPNNRALIVSPTLTAGLLDAYDDTLARAYTAPGKGVVKLSLAYGRNQRLKKLHLPEGCYKAQGFNLEEIQAIPFYLNSGRLHVGTFVASSHNSDRELVLFWLVYGGINASSRMGWRYELFEQQVKGLIPDGLLFRISTNVDKQSDTPSGQSGMSLLRAFANDMASAMPETVRHRYFPI